MVAFTCRFWLSSKQLDRLNVYVNEQSYFCNFILYNKQLKDERGVFAVSFCLEYSQLVCHRLPVSVNGAPLTPHCLPLKLVLSPSSSVSSQKHFSLLVLPLPLGCFSNLLLQLFLTLGFSQGSVGDSALRWASTLLVFPRVPNPSRTLKTYFQLLPLSQLPWWLRQ